jgi:hypothetical protein
MNGLCVYQFQGVDLEIRGCNGSSTCIGASMLRSSLVRTLTDKSQLPLDSVCAARKGENTRRIKTDARDRVIIPPLFSSY